MTDKPAPLKIIFAGTPSIAVPSLQSLIDSPHEVVAVYTQPDRPAGRGRKLQAPPVKQLALEHQLIVQQPDNLKTHSADKLLLDYQADLMVVMAYGLMIPDSILQQLPYGAINIHVSLLPSWRGAAPIQRAIAAGDKVSGITFMQMDSGLDTGDILSQIKCHILDTDTSITLQNRLAQLAADSLPHLLEQLQHHQLTAVKQNHQLASYAKKLSKTEAQIDWWQSADTIERQIRALQPWPVAFSYYHDMPIKILQAKVLEQTSEQPAGTIIDRQRDFFVVATVDKPLAIEYIQLPGKKILSLRDIFNAKTDIFQVGETLHDGVPKERD